MGQWRKRKEKKLSLFSIAQTHAACTLVSGFYNTEHYSLFSLESAREVFPIDLIA